MQKAIIIESENIYGHFLSVGTEVEILSQGKNTDYPNDLRVRNCNPSGMEQIVHLNNVAFLMPYNPS